MSRCNLKRRALVPRTGIHIGSPVQEKLNHTRIPPDTCILQSVVPSTALVIDTDALL